MKKKGKILQLQIRVSPREKELIIRAADKANMSISEWVLNKTLPPQQEIFQDLLARLKNASDPKYVLAEIHDLINAAGADEFELIASLPPRVLLPEYWANYIAAIIEYASVQKGKRAPDWVKEIPAMTRPIFGSDLESLKLHLLTHSPPPFRRRNIFIDSTIGQRV